MRRRWNRVALMAAAAMTAVVASAQGADNPAPGPFGVRALNPDVQEALTSGLKRSETLRSLVHEIEMREGVVVVESVSRPRLMRAGILGATSHDIVAAGTLRVIRVAIVTGQGDATIATVAHELRHVTEILESGARDRKDVQALYARIGVEMRRGVFETMAASAAGWQVRQELSERSGK